jgi:RNA polymerase-associated protein CTR9
LFQFITLIASPVAESHVSIILFQDNQDHRTLLSLGNMYLANLSTNPERYIKDSYKFFHRVLFDEPNNVYAANGLGIVCAEKGEFDVAREIITRVSE